MRQQHILEVGERIQPGDLARSLISGEWYPVPQMLVGGIYQGGEPVIMREYGCDCENTKPGEDNTP